METINQSRVAVIKKIVAKVQPEGSLFFKALEKLVDCSDEELDNFLRQSFNLTPKNGLTRQIFTEQNFLLTHRQGRRLISCANQVFKAGIDPAFTECRIEKDEFFFLESSLRLQEMISNGIFMNLFSCQSGSWNQKWVYQYQLVDFCETFPELFRQNSCGLIFLIKKDGDKTIDENNPGDNLVVARVMARAGGLCALYYPLDNQRLWSENNYYWLVLPRLIF